MIRPSKLYRLPLLLVLAGFGLAAALGMKRETGHLVVYCGRGEEMVRPLIEQFEKDTGIDVSVRYAGTAELAATLLEEGANSPADVFFAQDAGALGALNKQGALAALPADILSAVDPHYRSQDGAWVGISGRARVLVYNPGLVSADRLPQNLEALTGPEWKGRIGWAPENASFQSFITALRVQVGDEQAKAWLNAMQANEPRVYAKNSAIVAAVAAGEIEAGLVNHYYLYSARRTNPDLAARNHYFPEAGAGSLVNVAGAGILKTAKNPTAATTFLQFLLSPLAQTYFAAETHEYPLVSGVAVSGDLKPLTSLAIPEIDLNRLEDLEGTLSLIREAGLY